MNAMGDADWWQAIRPSETAFFLDVDGTLLGFKDRPEDVVADQALRDLLVRLQQVSGGAVAFVSGRVISDLDRIMAPLVLPAGGVHGAELRFVDRRIELFAASALTEIRSKAEAFVASHEGLRLEDKGGTTFAIHFRRAPAIEAEVTRFLEDAVSGQGLMVQHGKMVAEVKPRGCDKGTAILALMQTAPFAGRAPFFIGDDLTDEYGFDAVNRANGFSVKVGTSDEPTIAHHRLANISAVRDLLAFICRSEEGLRENNGIVKY